MENKRPTFEQTVDVLVKAYLNDTLKNGSCYACAVGNIIAASNGYKHDASDGDLCWVGFDSIYKYGDPSKMWTSLFFTSIHNGRQILHPSNYRGITKQLIDSTGYSWRELAKVEFAFEDKYGGEDPMFNALMAVVDVLAEIHGIDLSQKEEAKKLFVKV